MKPLNYFDVAGQLVAKHPVVVLKLEMTTHASAANGYWQVHDFAPEYNKTAPANGAVPLKTWPAAGAGGQDYKEFKGAELMLTNGLYICFSTTEATLTLGTGNNKFATLAVEVERPDPLAAVTAVEDSGAGVQLEVWSEADGPKRLVRVKVTNLAAAERWLMLFAEDSPADGSRPLRQWYVAGSGSLDLRFGDGLRFQDNDGSAGGTRRGCTLALSTTENTLTDDATDGMSIYAESLP